MKFYTSDLHFGHANVIKFDNRPFGTIEEMDRLLIEYWNGRVTDQDEIYIMGDLIFRSDKPAEWYLRQLKGKKYLVIGNHEKAILNDDVARSYFEAIDKMMHITDGKNQIHACHFPIVEWNGYFRGHYHIHGHIHSRKDYKSFEVMKSEERALNAGCMINNYMPVTFQELVANNQIFKNG